jgi:hypothetical protein
VQYIVSAGADVNCCKRIEYGEPFLFPLISARNACPRSRAVLRVLLDAGIDLSVRDPVYKNCPGLTVFMAAVEGRGDWVAATFIRDMAEAVLKRGLCGTATE